MSFLQGIAKVNSHSLVLPLCCYNPNIKPFYFFSDFNVNFAFISRLLLLFLLVIFLMFRTRKAKKRSHTFCWFWCVCVCVFHCQSVPTLTLTNPKKKETTHTKLLWMSQEAKHQDPQIKAESREGIAQHYVASSVASCAGAVPCALSSFNPLQRSASISIL